MMSGSIWIRQFQMTTFRAASSSFGHLSHRIHLRSVPSVVRNPFFER